MVTMHPAAMDPDALAAEWGVERDPACKVVWAKLCVEEADLAG